MCGIGGFFAQQPVAPQVVGAMRAALAPRGPDAHHAKLWERNGLLHARLSIIDPRPLADQPMANEGGNVWIVYNGEVYDWEAAAAELKAHAPFRTRSDTEFILRGYEAWGIEKLLERLRGMFAFAILDLAKGKAFLARDRMGEKPLIYSMVHGALAFGSTVRAVLPFLPREKRELSAAGVDAYLAHRYIPAPRTVYRHVQRLENGHYLEFDLRSRELAKRRYWNPRPERGPWLDALDESVRMRTIAERPLGVFLSGGIDSTVVASRLAAQGLTNLRTYTAAFPGSDMDESAVAADTAARLGFPNRCIPIPGAIGPDFETIVAALDEPFADPSSFPTWYLARETSREVKVVLAGDGGDELFGGYKRIAKHLRTAWRGNLRLPLRVRPALEGGKLSAEVAMDWRTAYSLRFSGMAPAQRAFLQGGRLEALAHWRSPDAHADTPLKILMAIDNANYLPEYILRKSDLCTMAHGLEARAPFLDHHFVQRLLAEPEDSVYTKPPKRMLQAGLDARLPGDFLSRKKRGFNPPLARWLREELAPRFDGLGERLQNLTSSQLRREPVDAFVQRYVAGAERLAEQVLQLVILDECLRQLAAHA
ncbi:MAG TPA: asparagine synthase (glutamine-hydrolyzing) [Burkholderiales bacterium]|nr:asparagine synthase (glutamine-hydrolyzing) [Burkholderiales bacterium]